jgi:hypothetical protein
LDIAERTEERWMNAELYRLRGEIVMAEANDYKIAESSFRNGLEIAQVQGSRALGLRLTTSLAKLWADNGSFDRAVKTLGSTLEPFIRGSESIDVAAARKLLASLGT